jgi:hypothetical protein
LLIIEYKLKKRVPHRARFFFIFSFVSKTWRSKSP